MELIPPSGSGKVSQLEQGLYELLIIPPAPDRARVDFLAHLPVAGGQNRPAGHMELEAPRIPVEARELDDPPAPRLLIGYEPGVRHLEQGARRKRRAPVIHQPVVLAVVVREIGKIESEARRVGEILEIAGQTGVDRIALEINDTRARKYGVYEPQMIRIDRGLVDHPQRIGGGVPAHRLRIGLGQFSCQRRIRRFTPQTFAILVRRDVPKVELTRTSGARMRGDDLLNEGGA